MPPRAEEYDAEVGTPLYKKPEDSEPIDNDDLIKDVGKVHMDKAMPWGRGIIHDIRGTVMTNWVKEMTNLNQKTVAVTLLLFISVIAPTLTFGAVYGKVTENRIGAVETILATSWVGIAYALIGGMPLCIIGSTGPILAFTRALISIADSLDIPFLPFNAWVSVWLVIYTFIAGFFDLTRLVRLATRFTDEIFALLIVSIFVLDAVGDPFSNVGILRYFDPNHPSHEKFEDDENYSYMETALLSTILGFGTTAFIFFFRTFRTSTFFCNDQFRTSVHDFAVTLAVIVATVIKEFLFPQISTEQFNVPDTFEPSFQCCDASCRSVFPAECADQLEPVGLRSWLVDFSDLNGKGYAPILAAGPAFLAFFLVYLDNGITWHLINHKSHNLVNGEAYNYDLCLSGIFNFVNGALGLPWLVATTVPCIIHLHALAEKDATGKFISVQETRLTALFAHLIMACCLLALTALQILPLPVLYGVFLFMGMSSLPGLQFYQRFLLFFRQPSKYPETVYTKYLPKRRVHLYTVFQIFFFGLVFTVQNFPAIAVAFPLMTLLCLPGRLKFLPCFFKGWELLLLDGEDEAIEEWVRAKERAVRKVEFATFDMAESAVNWDTDDEDDVKGTETAEGFEMEG